MSFLANAKNLIFYQSPKFINKILISFCNDILSLSHSSYITIMVLLES